MSEFEIRIPARKKQPVTDKKQPSCESISRRIQRTG